MNGRIQELVKQVYGSQATEQEIKLAELIVKECVKSLWTEECRNSDLALEEFNRKATKIKQHFGVKE